MRDQIVPIAAARRRPVARKNKQNMKTGDVKADPNDKNGAILIEHLICAFEELGGQAYLVALAREDPKTFLALLGKVLPYQAKGFGTGAVDITITIGGHED